MKADPTPAEYPKRPKFWAVQLIRAVTKSCAAQEVGPSGFALLAVIATTEDAAGYRRAVTYYDSQLLPLIGLESQKSLAVCRKKCVEAGWLIYRPGSKGRAGQYWTVIPDHADGLDDHPTDEGQDDSRQMPRKIYGESGNELGTNRERIGDEATGQRATFLTYTYTDTGTEDKDPDLPIEQSQIAVPAFSQICKDFAEEWNRSEHFQECRKFTDARKKSLKKRLADPDFVENWRAALDRIRGSSFCCGQNDRNWKAEIDWFLRSDTVTKILEGKYDSRSGWETVRAIPTGIDSDPRGNLAIAMGYAANQEVSNEDSY